MSKTTTYRFDQNDGAVVYASTHTDYNGNQSVLFERHSGTKGLIGHIRLTAEQAAELKTALDGWGF